MAQRNEFVDNVLSDKSSLIHLLDSNDMLKITKKLTYLSIPHIMVKLIFQNFWSKKQD